MRTDLEAALERFADRGTPRGAPTVLRNTYALMDGDVVDAARMAEVVSRRPRRPLRVAVAVVALLVGVGAAWQLTRGSDDSGRVVTAPSSRPTPSLSSLPPGYERIGSGAEKGHSWTIGVRKLDDGRVRVRLGARTAASEFLVIAPGRVNASSVTGGRSRAVYTWGTVPPETVWVRVTRQGGGGRLVPAVGDPSRFGVRFFASVDKRPASTPRRIEALGADLHPIATSALGDWSLAPAG